MDINCEFKDIVLYGYSCTIREANITQKDQVIKEFKGDHEAGKSHSDVQYMWFSRTNVNHFPRDLGKHFPNLTQLIIERCGIKEITKSDLKGLEGLVALSIVHCQLKSLPDDLFAEMPNLRGVILRGNKIEFASSNLLKPLLGREYVEVSLEGNKNIDACYSWEGVKGSIESLEDLMKLIDEKCIKPARTTECMDIFDGNQLTKEMWISGRFSDLTIIAGEKEFKVHKTILGMRCEVFAETFEDQSEANEMIISDFSSGAVEALLKFIYTNEIAEDGNAKENFEIADKFKVAAMKMNYEKIICDQTNESNAWEFFLFAHRFTSQLLKEKSFPLIVKNIPDEVTNELMEDPEELKKLLVCRRAYEEVLKKWKKLNIA